MKRDALGVSSKREDPLTRSDFLLDSRQWSSLIVGKISEVRLTPCVFMSPAVFYWVILRIYSYPSVLHIVLESCIVLYCGRGDRHQVCVMYADNEYACELCPSTFLACWPMGRVARPSLGLTRRRASCDGNQTWLCAVGSCSLLYRLRHKVSCCPVT